MFYYPEQGAFFVQLECDVAVYNKKRECVKREVIRDFDFLFYTLSC